MRVKPSLLIVLLALSGCGKAPEAPNAPRVLKVDTGQIVAQGSLTRESRFFGLIEPRQTSELAFELSGTVEEIFTNEGDDIRKGDRLARLDHARLEARITAADAAVNEADATRHLAEITFERLDRLLLEDAASQQELDEAHQALRVAQATVDRLKAEADALRVDLSKTTLYAPYDGSVVRRYVDEGASIGPARAVLQVIENETLEARIGLAPDAAQGLEVGDEVNLRLPGKPHEAFTGSILRLIPLRESRTRTVDVIVDILAPGIHLHPGDAVEVVLPRQEKAPGFWIPRESLTENVRGLWSVFVVDENEDGHPVVSREPVEIIHFESDRVYVHGPLDSGDQIVISGIHRLAPGQRVDPQVGS